MDPLRALNPRTVAEAQEAGPKHLAVRCEKCGHEGQVPWGAVARVVRLDKMSDMLKCSTCGAGQPTTWPWMEPRDLKRLQQAVRN